MRKHSYSKQFVKHFQQIMFNIHRKVGGMSNLKMLKKSTVFWQLSRKDTKIHWCITTEYFFCNCHNPNDNTMQHNLKTVVGLDMKMTEQTPPPPPHKLNSSLHKPKNNIHCWQLNVVWSATTSRAMTTTTTKSTTKLSALGTSY